MITNTTANMATEIWTEAAIWRGKMIWLQVYSIFGFLITIFLALAFFLGMGLFGVKSRNRVFVFLAPLVLFTTIAVGFTWADSLPYYGMSIGFGAFTIPILPAVLPSTCEAVKRYQLGEFSCDVERLQGFAADLAQAGGWKLLFTPKPLACVGLFLVVFLLPALSIGYLGICGGWQDNEIITADGGEKEAIRDPTRSRSSCCACACHRVHDEMGVKLDV